MAVKMLWIKLLSTETLMVEKLGFFCRYIDMFHYMYNNMKRRQGSQGPVYAVHITIPLNKY